MGCRQSSVATPPPVSDAPPVTPRLAWIGSDDDLRADSPTVPIATDSSEEVVSKPPTRKRKRKKVKSAKVVPVISATQGTVMNMLTRGNKVILPPLQQHPLPPGVVMVREANPDSRVDLTRPTSLTTQIWFGSSRHLPPLKQTPTTLKHVTIPPKPVRLPPIEQPVPREDHQLSACGSNVSRSVSPDTQQLYMSIIGKMYCSESDSSDSDSDSEIHTLDTSLQCPEPAIVNRPSTRGGIAFDIVFPNAGTRPNTPSVPRPMSVMCTRPKTAVELDIQQQLAELRRTQQQLERLAQLKAQERNLTHQRAGVSSQPHKERVEYLKKTRKERAF